MHHIHIRNPSLFRIISKVYRISHKDFCRGKEEKNVIGYVTLMEVPNKKKVTVNKNKKNFTLACLLK